MNQTPTPQTESDAREDALHEAAVAVEALADFSDDDVLNVEPVQAVPITLQGKTQKALVRCLTGKQAIKLIRDAGKSSESDPDSVLVMKLVRCLASPSDPSKPRYTDASAMNVLDKGSAGALAELLRAIHFVNPLIKNAG